LYGTPLDTAPDTAQLIGYVDLGVSLNDPFNSLAYMVDSIVL